MDSGSLRKILDLEQKRGYQDSAVFGGLDGFLHNWSTQAVESMVSPRLLKRFRQLFKSDYASMTPEQRREWVNDVLDFHVLNVGQRWPRDNNSALRVGYKWTR